MINLLCLSASIALLGIVPLYGQTLTIKVTDIKTESGFIRVGLFSDAESFPENAARGDVVKVTGSTVVVTFQNLPAGQYAISAIHDENGNEEFDTNLLGIPKEGFGFSNDAMGLFGPPSFDKAKIDWPGEDKTVSFRMKYF